MKARYEGLRWTGSQGEDYATIALLPNATHDGTMLALQGLQQEGTEAAGRFLADQENRRQLRVALGLSPSSETFPESIWFEALIRSHSCGGTEFNYARYRSPNSLMFCAVSFRSNSIFQIGILLEFHRVHEEFAV